MPNFRFDFDLSDVTLEEVNDAEVSIEASDKGGGDILRFKNATLARAEINANNDELSDENITELAATLAPKPINLEHSEGDIKGVFTSARNVGGVLVSDGIVFAKIFPDIAKGIMDGTYKLSVEGEAEAVERVGKVRRFFNLKANGGGLTRKPAGTDTGFGRSSLLLIASKQSEKEEEDVDKIKELEATVSELNEKIEALEKEKDGISGELRAEREKSEKLEAAVIDVEKVKADTEAAIKASQEEQEAFKAVQKLSATRASKLLSAGVAEEEVEEIWDELGGLSEKVFAKMVPVAIETSEPKEMSASQEEKDEPAPKFTDGNPQDSDGKMQKPELIFEFSR